MQGVKHGSEILGHGIVGDEAPADSVDVVEPPSAEVLLREEVTGVRRARVHEARGEGWRAANLGDLAADR